MQYAPPLGIEGRTPTLDPDLAAAYELALHMHESRMRVLPRIIAVPQPAAQTEWSVQVPGGRLWIPIAVRAHFLAGNTGLSRQPLIVIGDGNDSLAISPGNMSVASAVSADLFWSRNIGQGVGNSSALMTTGSIAHAPVPENWTIGSSTVQLGVNDQYSVIRLYVLQVTERTPSERAAYMEALLTGEATDNYPGLLLGL